jgi:exportin-5
MQLIARGQPLEARHFGYGILQHVVAKRWSQFTQPERQELAKLVYDKLSECGAVPADEPPEPFMIKSKVATLMAQVVRQEGVGMWSSIMPEMAAGACSESPVQAELSALVMRYVAEDVAVYNSDILGGRMKELLYGLTSTLPQALPAMYRLLEVSEDFFTFVFDFVFPVSPAPALRLGPGLDAADEQTQGSTNRTSSCGILITSI